MNSRQRFLETMRYGAPDRVPLFREGMREETLLAWQAQGLPDANALEAMFHYDDFEEIEPDLDPRPEMEGVPKGKAGLRKLRRRLDADDPGRLPEDWEQKVRVWKERQGVLFFRIHRGFFLTMGVEGWGSFREAIRLLKDDPETVHQVMGIQAEFAARMAERVLRQVQVDGVIFSEPISGNNGPLISPKMYRDFVLDSYEPVLDVLEEHGVPLIILRTYANPRLLLPVALERRFNCLWACETNPESMDYRPIRAEFGPELRLIGGIDTDILRLSREAIRYELEEKVTPLLEEGGFVPLADGRVREDMPFENYVFYRRFLEETLINLKYNDCL